MTIKYQDRFLWIIVYPLMAIGAVHIANDNSFTKLLTLPSYYTDLLFAFVFVYATGFYTRFLIIKLDHKFNWAIAFRKRLAWQFMLGIVAPLLMLVAAESIYLVYGLGIPLSESPMFYLEVPVSFVFLVLINACYYILFLRSHAHSPGLHFGPFAVSKGYRQQSIEQSEIAYFYIEEGTTFLCTTGNDRYMVSGSIESLEKRTDPTQFYKLNRQVLASRISIDFVENTPTRKLIVALKPPLHIPVHVSKANASDFQRWFRNSTPVSM